MFYIYSIKSLENGKVYIGSRTAKCMRNRKPEEDLGVRYFSSSRDKELRRAIKDGKVSYRVIKEYSDAKECVRDENELIRLFWLFFGKENSYNHCYSKCNGEKVWSTAGISPSEETRKKHSKARKGKHSSEETKKKLRESRNEYYKTHPHPCKGKHLSEETKKKLREANTGENHPLWGKHRSEETKKKSSKTHIEYYKTHTIWSKGKPKSEETRKKMSESAKKKFYWKTSSGEIEIMDKSHARRYHPDWIEIGPVE